MDVDGDLGLRQFLKLLVGQGERLLDLAEDLEVPRREIRLRNRSRVQHRPLLRQVLPGRQAGRVESLLDQLLLGLATEQ